VAIQESWDALRPLDCFAIFHPEGRASFDALWLAMTPPDRPEIIPSSALLMSFPVSLSVGRPDRPARPRSRSKTLLPFNRNHTGASRGRQAFVCLKRNGAAKGHFSPMAYRRPGLLAEATMRARPVASPDASAPSHGWTQRRDDPERAGNPQFAIFSRRLRTSRSRRSRAGSYSNC
jgi:hypothetical protein